jgi:isocitrate dehydrogenase kinase/phosphatase
MRDPILTHHSDAEAIAARAKSGFQHYNERFGEISRRARLRFENRDWAGTRADVAERMDLYNDIVRELTEELEVLLGPEFRSRELWHRIRDAYSSLVENCIDAEFYKTFFSSLTRRVFSTVGVDPYVEFIALEITPARDVSMRVARRTYRRTGPLPALFTEILRDYGFSVPYRDVDGSAAFAARRATDFEAGRHSAQWIRAIELLETVFYQTNRAYLVGRMIGEDGAEPIVIALMNGPAGVDVDAVLIRTEQLRVLFGFTRSYFLADLSAVGPTVLYLQELMPEKRIEELYTVLGRARQGKTERYRSFFHHLAASSDLFQLADGDRGMVMAVFTLPSYDLVFKVIRDHFAYPKECDREEVMAKYQLVFKHDRAGRIVDAQEFRRLEFPRARFAPEALDDLLVSCSKTCSLVDNMVLIDHLYVERRVRPLNLYLREAAPEAARKAIIDYGQAIRDLAVTNIFPGDLLLKNFGVTRLGRVIFYDYDELCFVTDCNFRELPRAGDFDDEMRASDWFYVGPRDVFPEQFGEFFGLSPELMSAFLEHHSELLTPQYWRQLQERHSAGQVIEVIPYWALNRARWLPAAQL